MPDLSEAGAAERFKTRVMALRPDSQRQWGSMTVAQALAHLSVSLEMAVGDRRPPRMLVGRFLGPMVRRKIVADDRPLRKNSPTAPDMVITDERELRIEQERLCALIDRFTAGGPERCTTHPHEFFGTMNAREWSILTYKHLDHHLRQFGA